MPNAREVLGLTIEERDRLRAELGRLKGAIQQRIQELGMSLEGHRDPVAGERNRAVIAELRRLIEPRD